MMSDPESNRHFVAGVGDIGDGERVIREIRGREIAVFRYDDAFHAIANYCPHQGGPVCEGYLGGRVGWTTDRGLTYLDDGIIACPWHGWEFDLETGSHLTGSGYRLVVYDVVVDAGDIFVIVD